MTFEEIGIDGKYIKAIKELGFEKPMPVQEKVIPYLIKNDSPDKQAQAKPLPSDCLLFKNQIRIQNMCSI